MNLKVNNSIMSRKAKKMKTYDDVNTAFETGKVLDASKEDLEFFLLAIGKVRIQSPINQAKASEMGETIRILLAARQSQEMHSEATKISKIALIVSFTALAVSVMQIILQYLLPILPAQPGASQARSAPVTTELPQGHSR